MHDDLQVMRVYEMGKCFSDGQIPCRWSPDMVYGYGQAMFNYYSAFPYYLGQFIRMTLPVSIMATVKLLFFISLIGAAFGMYLLAKEFWGKTGGILAALFYTYAPYHALDIFVRGALAESFSLAILPFLWLSLYKLIKNPSFVKVFAASILVFLLLTTHNISSMIYAPFTTIWVLFWIIYLKNWRSTRYVVTSGLFGLGLSSFFILPAIFEQNLIRVEYLTLDYSDFHAHFVTLNQLFLERKWGYGPSIFGPYDDLSFQIGWPHWFLGFIVIGIVIYGLGKRKYKEVILAVSLITLFLFTAFLAHPRSLFIWESLPLIKFVQFPWRFLGLSMFFLSFALGNIGNIRLPLKPFFVCLIFILTLALNIGYFKPYNFSRQVKDEDKLTGIGFDLQQKAAILDYLPKTAEIAPPAPAFEVPKVISGEGVIDNFTKQSNRFSFDADIYSASEVVVPVMYFPNWIVIVDNQKVASGINGAHGVISVKLSAGKHIVRGRFTDTPVRSIGNAITVITAVLLFSASVIAERRKNV
ncbi:MAG: hypothetical protein UT24_C0013G0010 [Candidatus Woesebacteria bacterium GW2011_GWB1_39_12]|uniref:Membrane protein 6-pyruvoyl-tetrahydropterin synthase-related domain-containing protein n=2 Tax=Candidatus Woeseibacteriota TaxID=1752722 RepID=A0A0G0M8A4_9BACT|nr:MAG: hypothetical protein UT24_C0013G0010 [Candidatus Woesebacteria bacterium GW2011_GWB1_39_12]